MEIKLQNVWLYHRELGARLFKQISEETIAGLARDGWADSPGAAALLTGGSERVPDGDVVAEENLPVGEFLPGHEHESMEFQSADRSKKAAKRK